MYLIINLNKLKMKKLLLLTFVLLTFMSYGQEKVYDTLFCSQVPNIDYVSQFRNSDRFKTIKFEDGSSINMNDLIKVGKPSGINMTHEQSSGLFSSTRQQSNNFSYLVLGRAAMAALGGITYVPEKFKGNEIRLIEIKIAHTGFTHNSPASVILIFENPGLDISVWSYKKAFEEGELINPNRPMNRTEAIAKLKETKDLLDLGMITKDDFDKMKEKLTPIISQNK